MLLPRLCVIRHKAVVVLVPIIGASFGGGGHVAFAPHDSLDRAKYDVSAARERKRWEIGNGYTPALRTRILCPATSRYKEESHWK